VRYTLWSHGRLLGESELDYPVDVPCHRVGDFTPTDAGERLMPTLAAANRVAVAMEAIAREWRLERLSDEHNDNEQSFADHSRRAGVECDLAEVEARQRALALELRDEAGELIETESIEVRDNDLVHSMVEDRFPNAEEFCETTSFESVADPMEMSFEIPEGSFVGLDDDDALLEEMERELALEALEEEELEIRWASGFPRYQIHVVLCE
jgi:hypothetical protein